MHSRQFDFWCNTHFPIDPNQKYLWHFHQKQCNSARELLAYNCTRHSLNLFFFFKFIHTCGLSVRSSVCRVSRTALRTDEIVCLMNGQSLWTSTLRGGPRPEWTQAEGCDSRVDRRFMMLLVDAERSSRSTRVSQRVWRISITWTKTNIKEQAGFTFYLSVSNPITICFFNYYLLHRE